MIKLFQKFVILLLLSSQLLNAKNIKNSIATIELGLMGYEYWHALKQQKNNNPLSLPPLKKISIEPPIESPKYKSNSYPYLWYGLGGAAVLAGASWLLYSWLHSKTNIKSPQNNVSNTSSFKGVIIEDQQTKPTQRFTRQTENINVSQKKESELNSQSAAIVQAKIPQQNDLHETIQPNTNKVALAKQTLGLSQSNPTLTETEHAFRQLAKYLHPDHGGNLNHFQNLVLARDLLLGTKKSEQETTKIPTSDNYLAITYPTQKKKHEPNIRSSDHPLQAVEPNNFQEEIVEEMLAQEATKRLAQAVDSIEPTSSPMIPLPKKIKQQRNKQHNKLTSSIIGSPIPTDLTTLKSLHSINDLAKKLTNKKITRDSFKQNTIPAHHNDEVLNSELRLTIAKINLLNEEWDRIEKTLNQQPFSEKAKLKKSIRTLITKISEITQPTYQHFKVLQEMLQEKTSSDTLSDNTQSSATRKQLTMDMIQKAVTELKNKIK